MCGEELPSRFTVSPKNCPTLLLVSSPEAKKKKERKLEFEHSPKIKMGGGKF